MLFVFLGVVFGLAFLFETGRLPRVNRAMDDLMTRVCEPGQIEREVERRREAAQAPGPVVVGPEPSCRRARRWGVSRVIDACDE